MGESSTEFIASAGKSEVSADFARIGWGPSDNPYHDHGTDLWVLVLDGKGIDLGLMVGVQVKAGSSYFDQPEEKDGQILGWWFRDTQKHFDYWLGFSIAHLVVLHDMDTKISYWAHITPESVQSTGKNSKIFVPAKNVIDESNLEPLIEVAGSAGSPWEGSAWKAGRAVAAEDRLRHALVTPRLMAPHPNAGFPEPPSADQAVAMLVQARIRELAQCGDRFEDFPSHDEAPDSSDWLWKFYAAMWDRVVGSKAEGLIARCGDAPFAYARCASTVAAASLLTETGHAAEAIELLTGAIELEECGPIDQAWLLVQRARALAEIGKIEEAHNDAIIAQGARSRAPMDATAGAISASAAVLIFNTAEWGERNIEEVIIRSDTVAGWWQSQVTSRALGSALERSFKNWAEDLSVTIGGEDVVHNQLEAASLTSSHEGDQAGWRQQAGRQAMALLNGVSRGDSPENVSEALTALRMTGSEKWLSLATSQLSAGGPARAVSLAGREVDLACSTLTTSYSDLRFLKLGGDMLESEVATRSARSILEILDDPVDFVSRCRPGYRVDHALIEALSGVIGAADDELQRDVAERILSLPPQTEQFYSEVWTRLAAALPLRAFLLTDAETLIARADDHHFPLPNKLLRIAHLLGDEHAREILVQQVRSGSSDAMVALGDVSAIDAEGAAMEIARLAESAESIIRDAQDGKFGVGAIDVSHALALMNIEHPAHARWDSTISLIGEDAVAVGQKAATIHLLATQVEKIPEEVKAPLSEVVLRIARNEGEVTSVLFDHRDDVSAEAVHLALALGAFGPQEGSDQIARLLDGGPVDRARVATIAGSFDSPFHRGVLVALASDVDGDVRAEACAWLCHLAAQSMDLSVAGALRRASKDPGRKVPMHLALGLELLEASSLSEARALAVEIRNELVLHPSARVRARALETES